MKCWQYFNISSFIFRFNFDISFETNKVDIQWQNISTTRHIRTYQDHGVHSPLRIDNHENNALKWVFQLKNVAVHAVTGPWDSRQQSTIHIATHSRCCALFGEHWMLLRLNEIVYFWRSYAQKSVMPLNKQLSENHWAQRMITISFFSTFPLNEFTFLCCCKSIWSQCIMESVSIDICCFFSSSSSFSPPFGFLFFYYWWG